MSKVLVKAKSEQVFGVQMELKRVVIHDCHQTSRSHALEINNKELSYEHLIRNASKILKIKGSSCKLYNDINKISNGDNIYLSLLLDLYQ